MTIICNLSSTSSTSSSSNCSSSNSSSSRPITERNTSRIIEGPTSSASTSTTTKRTTNTTTRSTRTRIRKSVEFCTIEIREHERRLGDNPTAMNGPPLGLDWSYTDYNTISIDEYEKEVQQFRQQRHRQHSASAGTTIINGNSNIDENGSSSSSSNCTCNDDLYHSINQIIITKEGEEEEGEQIKMINKEQEQQGSRSQTRRSSFQPIPGYIREQILLEETKTTPQEIEEFMKQTRKIQQQRLSTITMLETGFDQFTSLGEFFSRRYRRLRSGISKEREQELLWEQANKNNINNSMSSNKKAVTIIGGGGTTTATTSGTVIGSIMTIKDMIRSSSNNKSNTSRRASAPATLAATASLSSSSSIYYDTGISSPLSTSSSFHNGIEDQVYPVLTSASSCFHNEEDQVYQFR